MGFYSYYVYSCAPKEVYQELIGRNPKNENGNRKFRHHQFLTEVARKWLERHLATLETMIRGTQYNPISFKILFRQAFPKNRCEPMQKKIANEVRQIQMELEFEF
jgi:hypothetical protein